MNLSLLFDLLVGGLISFFTAQGDARAVESLKKLQQAKSAGANINAELAELAESLNSGEPLDWDAMDAKIDAAVEAFTADN